MSAQNNQLFGYATESEDVVIRRLSRRVMRYLELLQTLPPELRAPQRSMGLNNVPPPPPGSSRTHPVSEVLDSHHLENAEPEFAEDVPTHVSLVRGDAPVSVPDEIPSSGGPLSIPSAPPSSLSHLQPPPPPTRLNPNSEVVVRAPLPPVNRRVPKSSPPEQIVAKAAQKESKVTAVSGSAAPRSLGSEALRTKDEELPDTVPSGTLVMVLLIVSAALLLAGLVYWLLTFDKFVY